jgi:hypothetical protein
VRFLGLKGESIRQKVYDLLDKNPLLKPLEICKILDLRYKDYRNYVTKLRCTWKKHYLRKREGLNRLSFHNWHGFVYVPGCLRLGDELSVEGLKGRVGEVGWAVTDALNHMLVWDGGELGRLEWFPTSGRVKVFVRSPPSRGKACQLLSDGFFGSGLIFDVRVFEEFVRGLRFKGASCVVEVGERLPYVKFDLLRESSGVSITLGDRSHPSGLEVDFCYPDWAERNESLLRGLQDLFNAEGGVGLEGKPSYVE